MPILRTRHRVESPTGTFVVLHELADSSDFGLLGEQSSPKCEIPYLAGTPMNRCAKFDAAIALSSPEKSVTVQTHKITKKETVNDICAQLLFVCSKCIITMRVMVAYK